MTTGTMLRSDVARLMRQHGQDITFRRIVQGLYNPSTGTTGTATNSDETARIAFVSYLAREIDGTNVQRGDRKAIMAMVNTSGTALSKTPQINDQLIGEGDTVSVVDVRTVKSGSTVVAYICQVRE